MPRSRKTITYVGVDPGMSGGLAWIGSVSVACENTPKTERDIWDWFEALPNSNSIAVIEKVHSFPQQGVASTFKFGRSYGFLRGCLIASSISFREVSPRSWQKELGIVPRKKTESKSQWKQRLKGIAQQRFPEVEISLQAADSLLIAEYCKKSQERTL